MQFNNHQQVRDDATLLKIGIGYHVCIIAAQGLIAIFIMYPVLLLIFRFTHLIAVELLWRKIKIVIMIKTSNNNIKVRESKGFIHPSY